MAKRWRRAAISFGGRVPPQVLIPDCVDEAIVAFLRAIDQGLLSLSFTTASGETVDLAKEGRGELAAKYMANGGWRAKYSKERFFDNTRDWTPEELAAVAIPKSYHNAQMFDAGRKLTDADITHLEETIGLQLPETYRRYLTTFNGGAPSPNLLDIEGAPYDNIELRVFFSFNIQQEYRDLLRRWESVPGCKEKKLLPIGSSRVGHLSLQRRANWRRGATAPEAIAPKGYIACTFFSTNRRPSLLHDTIATRSAFTPASAHSHDTRHERRAEHKRQDSP